MLSHNKPTLMRIKPFQAVYPNLDFITSSDAFFSKVKLEYPAYKRSGFFQRTAREAVYIYEIASRQRTYTGLIVCASVEDYEEGLIKRHENTIATKEQQQMDLMISRDAIVKPVLLTYRGVKEIDRLLEDYKSEHPVFYETSFFSSQQKHRFWAITEGDLINQLQEYFLNKVGESYIADGHHRSSTVALMHKRLSNNNEDHRFDSFLSAFFPMDQLEVLDFNRIITDLNDNSLTTFMARISQLFDIEIMTIPKKPMRKHEIVMFLNREWFKLTWKPEILEPYKNRPVLLDASLLDEKVMKWILGIEDVRTDHRVKYVEGIKGLEDFRLKTLRYEHSVGFCLYPVALEELIAIADMNKTMPPKSTWFEPRMRNGLIIQEFGSEH
jgi:uncharacterized protein (DUF1015 family)